MTGRLAHILRRARGLVARGRAGYRARLAGEVGRYAACEEVHDLPAIFHYWSNRYLRPRLEAHGFSHPDAFFAKYAGECLACAKDAGRHGARLLSVGAGNCDTEVRLAAALRDQGHGEFVIECLDVNRAMLDRGRTHADRAGVSPHLAFVCADVNRFGFEGPYDAVIANQSLHHIVELERLFDGIVRSLAPTGRFIVSDMIGRNGHQRWPEARAIVDEFWTELPPAYRVNRQLRRTEQRFLDWDCSTSGFEGVRAQDILPLCVERFGFDLFIGFANVIDPFIDRGFGPNFDADAPWDRAFIDRVHARDEAEIRAGRVKPTHMFAVMTRGPGAGVHHDGLSPADAIRRPG
ncbi:MAG: class I SAM-dependent methyltransferase [Burkholderiales bacterium]|nr:class I SAM-dependent methyltransferase [Burkholderiales bacterium]MCC7116570.1 class I SAM-dependent methyltransferase [Burkholderiales bacterium]